MTNYKDVFVRVSPDGIISYDPRMSVREAREANFIVIKTINGLVVWKDRHDESGVSVTKVQALHRARFHVLEVTKNLKA